MKRFIGILLILVVLLSLLPAQNVGSDKLIIDYIILYADTQVELSTKVQTYLNLKTGWQPWGTIVVTTGYNITSGWNFSQVMVQYR